MSERADLPLTLPLDDAAADLALAGGKGASLARLAVSGLPVPGGFHVTTEAYRRFVTQAGLRELLLEAVANVTAADPATCEAAARRITPLFARGVTPEPIAEAVRAAYAALDTGEAAVAVRSSATAEDLPELSFAGQQDTYLNIQGEARVLDAVKRCWASLWTARAIGYRARHGIAPDDVALAVVVQKLVPAEAAGVLFTAHPLTGAREQVVINAAWGLGEAVVGGQVTPDTYVVDRASGQLVERHIHDKAVMTVRTPEGTHEEAVPDERRTQAVLTPEQAAELARLGVRIEALHEGPMDVEWALQGGRFFIVQARPITGLRTRERHFEEWNDSLERDALWTNGNLGEAIPDVMTPCTWSLVQRFMRGAMESSSLPAYRAYGNIGGRFYMSLSLAATLAAAFGMRKLFNEAIPQVFGKLPPGVEIPLLPLSRWQALRALLPTVLTVLRRIRANTKRLPAFFAEAPSRCDALRARIQATSSAAELATAWRTDVEPYFLECCHMLEAAAKQDRNALVTIRRDLTRLVGETDADALLTGLHTGTSQLASLGPLIGLEQLARGELDRDTFARKWGHRGPHEFEVSMPRPAEDPAWIDRQLAGLREAKHDVTSLLENQKAARAAVWRRLGESAPRQEASLRRKIERATKALRDREVARSEVIRVFWALRAFVLRAGELTGHGEALFFLSIEEILEVLGGSDAPLARIPIREATYERYRSLPPYPAVIRGRFDPVQWAANPNRRGDFHDEHGDSVPASDTVKGFPGSAGIIEGLARVLGSSEEGEQLQSGEILVTTVTNVGWTPLFPRAAAVVTDVGAPLSHAAIVARELGIPAVVGCGNATMRLRTGDRVRVDGSRGTVEVLKVANADT
jgi:pyruvate,water dikinase